jgi:GH35 family endo-1,4-beta-xylanase
VKHFQNIILARLALLFIIIISFHCVQRSSGQQESRAAYGLNVKFQDLASVEPIIKEIQIGSIRTIVHWREVQPTPDKFDWTRTDSVVVFGKRYGAEILFLVRSISPWGTVRQTKRAPNGVHSASLPLDLNLWKNFLRTMAERYKNENVHFEIENEVNLSIYWDGTVEEYCRLLKESYDAIRATRTKARVLASSLACGVMRPKNWTRDPEWRKWHDEKFMKIMETRAFDGINVHNYYLPEKELLNGFTFESYLSHIRRLMKEAKVDTLPVWITEIGYPAIRSKANKSFVDGNEVYQERCLQKSYKIAFAMGVDRLFWLKGYDDNAKYFGNTGLLNKNGKVRMAYRLLHSMIQNAIQVTKEGVQK